MSLSGSVAPLLFAAIAGSFHFLILPRKIPATLSASRLRSPAPWRVMAALAGSGAVIAAALDAVDSFEVAAGAWLAAPAGALGDAPVVVQAPNTMAAAKASAPRRFDVGIVTRGSPLSALGRGFRRGRVLGRAVLTTALGRGSFWPLASQRFPAPAQRVARDPLRLC